MIPAGRIFNGEVVLWEKTDDGARQVKLSATDAVHALSVDPEHWSLDEPKEPEPEPKPRKRGGRHHEDEE